MPVAEGPQSAARRGNVPRAVGHHRRNDILRCRPPSTNRALRQLKERLALDDRIIVGKGVEGLDEEGAVAGLEVDVA